MKTLYENGFSTPDPIDANRHAILMSYIDGYTFQRVKNLEPAIVEKTYHCLLDMVVRFAENGLIHSDFNEYNILIDDKEPFKVYVIDFPQMVSTDHKEAKMFFDRDIACIERLFRKKHNFRCERDALINFDDIVSVKRLDQEVKASGYWKLAGVKAKEVTEMEGVLERGNEGSDAEGQEGEEEEDEDHNDEDQDNDEVVEENNDEDIEDSEEEIINPPVKKITKDKPVEDKKITEPVVKIGWGTKPKTKVDDQIPKVESTKTEKSEQTIIKKKKIQKKAKAEVSKEEDKPTQEAVTTDNKEEIQAVVSDKKDDKNSESDGEGEGEGESEEGDEESPEIKEEYQMTEEEREKQDRYIKKALRRKFRNKKTFKSNKNKMKAIAALKKDTELLT